MFHENQPNPQHMAEYQSYLMRFWRDGRVKPWRASLHNALTGEQWYFAEPEQLFQFLQERLDGPDQPRPLFPDKSNDQR